MRFVIMAGLLGLSISNLVLASAIRQGTFRDEIGRLFRRVAQPQVNDDRIHEIVGKLRGCTGTIVSPPGVQPITILSAAHCPTGDQTFTIAGARPIPVTCVANKDFKGSSGEDVSLCTSAADQGSRTEFSGCLNTRVEPSGSLISVGYGNPVFGRGLTDMAGGINSNVEDIVQENRVIIARTPGGYVTPGDSGGPAFANLEKGGKFLEINGVNSKYINGTHVSYAPLSTQGNIDFFTRAIALFQQRLGITPRVCGINYMPPGLENLAPEKPQIAEARPPARRMAQAQQQVAPAPVAPAEVAPPARRVQPAPQVRRAPAQQPPQRPAPRMARRRIIRIFDVRPASFLGH